MAGIMAVCFSILGFRAAWTGEPVLAKFYMTVYPTGLFITVVQFVASHGTGGFSTLTLQALVVLGIRSLFLLYCFKVSIGRKSS